MDANRHDFGNLDRTGRATAALAVRPATIVYLVTALAVLVAWAVLASMAIRLSAVLPAWEQGPGSGFLGGLAHIEFPVFLETFVRLCLEPVGSGLQSFLALAAMWMLMAVAMMLPSATPLIRTYCEIADTAAAKGQAVVHPLVLVVGYLTIWALAAIAFAAISMATTRLVAVAGAAAPLPGLAAAFALILAGAYQFSGMKEACLTRCRNPFATLFSNWSTKRAAIYRLGLKEGLWCLGCCWALMLVMFAVGVMNIFWMALIALFTLVEKQTKNRLATHGAGALLMGWGLWLFVVSL